MSSVPNSNQSVSLQDSPNSVSLEAVAGDLTKRELKRRLWHMLPGMTPFILWAFPHEDPISPTLKAIILTYAMIVGGRIFLQFRSISRDKNDSAAGSVLGYVFSVVGTLLLFPAHAEVGFLVLGILAFGDGSATFGGLYFRSRKLPWNSDKSLAGMISFLTMGTFMGTAIYWGEANPSVNLLTALSIAAPTAFCAAIAESLPVKLNDNFRVGITAAIVAPLAHYLIVGM